MPTLEELAAAEPQDKLSELAANEPPPQAAPEPSIFRRYLSAMGHGSTASRVGGVVGGIGGGIVGAAGGPVGAVAGTVAGATLGNALGQRFTTKEDYSPEQQKALEDGKLPLGAAPDKGPPPMDWDAALADGATQGVFSGALRAAGGVAAKAGFPRVAGVLGAKPPMQAVVDSTPASVRGISTPALQTVDAASLAGAPAAKEIAAISAEQARRDAVMAVERQLSERTMAPIQSRMGARVPGLAQKTKGFVDELRTAVPPEKFDAAFSSAPDVAEAASNPTVMGARQQMIQEAVPQTVDNQALKLARRPLAAAEARGVAGPPTPHAADAVGLRELGGNLPMDNSYLTRVVNRVPGVGTAMQALPRGGMTPDRVTQTTAAVLGSRGAPTINPELAKMLSGGDIYRASPAAQIDTELLRKFLSAQQ